MTKMDPDGLSFRRPASVGWTGPRPNEGEGQHVLEETICQPKTLLVYDGPTTTIEPGDRVCVPVRVEHACGSQDPMSSGDRNHKP